MGHTHTFEWYDLLDFNISSNLFANYSQIFYKNPNNVSFDLILIFVCKRKKYSKEFGNIFWGSFYIFPIGSFLGEN